MRPLAHRLVLLSSSLLLLLAFGAAIAGWRIHAALRQSLPQLEGVRPLHGLTDAVTITRDALGVPTVRGANRADVSRALGFIHAQDRFFQMDLMRRRAAGELSAVFGPVTLPLDRQARPFRFRELAQRVLAASPEHYRSWIDAYTAGANDGLRALARKPFEYDLLRTEPQPWLAEDCVLIACAMVIDLQDETNTHELSLMTLRDQFGYKAASFFAPLLTPDDAALDGSTGPLAEIPGPSAIDLRRSDSTQTNLLSRLAPSPALRRWLEAETELHPGSNSMALSGAHTASGTPLLANDPHLKLGVPNLWYRVALEWPASVQPAASLHRVIGATIPGLPVVIIGSNGHIAWGLTTSYADTGDLVPIDVHPISHDLYRGPDSDELHQIEKHRDTIAVKGAPAETLESAWTRWGLIVGRDARERPLAHQWVSTEAASINLRFLELESATSAAAAIAIAHEAGIPAHNFLVVDRAGAIGWTIAGKLPERVGFDGRFPVSRTYGDRRWDGLLPPAKVPSILLPAATNHDAAATAPGFSAGPSDLVASGRFWTANNRVLGGDALTLLGDGGYMSPPRAAQIRDRLAALEHATPRHLLAVQLDDRAFYLDRWQKLLLATLSPAALHRHDSRAELRALVEKWTGYAAVDSVSYRLVRDFRSEVAALTFTPIFERCLAQTPQFDWRRFNYEAPLWTLLQQQPAHLLDPAFSSWPQLLLTAADRVITAAEADGPLDQATWGRRNTARIAHPLSPSLPRWAARWLDLPADPLPGDSHLPRIQRPSFGASMRFVVSPGRENEGLFQMVGGQSGHPLSPFYRAGHEAWVRGEPTPLLPGETRHTLTLTAAR